MACSTRTSLSKYQPQFEFFLLDEGQYHGNQLDTEYRYDPQGRLTAQRTGRRTGEQGFQAVSQRRLRYNNHGQLAQIDDQLRGRTRYHYDRLDRLKKVDGSNSERFIHDPAGNLLATQTPEDQCAPGRVQGRAIVSIFTGITTTPMTT